jgi:hypothetical protein
VSRMCRSAEAGVRTYTKSAEVNQPAGVRTYTKSAEVNQPICQYRTKQGGHALSTTTRVRAFTDRGKRDVRRPQPVGITP